MLNTKFNLIISSKILVLLCCVDMQLCVSSVIIVWTFFYISIPVRLVKIWILYCWEVLQCFAAFHLSDINKWLEYFFISWQQLIHTYLSLILVFVNHFRCEFHSSSIISSLVTSTLLFCLMHITSNIWTLKGGGEQVKSASKAYKQNAVITEFINCSGLDLHVQAHSSIYRQ